ANKAADRYRGDPDYWFLHDRVSDLMAECLKHDIQQFNQHLQQRREREREQGQDQDPNEKKMQTLEFNVTFRLRIRIFEPNVSVAAAAAERDFGTLGTSLGSCQPNWCQQYMVALQKATAAAEDKPVSLSESMIEAGAVLPHTIVRYAVNYNARYERAADLQWKRMVEDVYKKQGRLNNCLAVVSYSENPQLHLVRGEDLKSKFSFMRSLVECQDWEVDLGKVKDFSDGCWKPCGGDYEEIQRKFEEKGYAVPHLVIWNLSRRNYTPLRTGEPGVTLLGGFSDAMLKCFLENDGELGPDQVMELAISPQCYQTLAVFD
ncbi:unnamed protein product, partial [Prunus brigantina]